MLPTAQAAQYLLCVHEEVHHAEWLHLMMMPAGPAAASPPSAAARQHQTPLPSAQQQLQPSQQGQGQGGQSHTLQLLEELSRTNRPLFNALMSMERDPSGKLSDQTLARINTVLESASQGSAASSPAASSGSSVKMGSAGAGVVRTGGPSVKFGGPTHAEGDDEDSEDSLQAALNR